MKIITCRGAFLLSIVIILSLAPMARISSTLQLPDREPYYPGPQPTPRSVLLTENFSAPWVPCGTGYDAPPGWTVEGISTGQNAPYLTHYWSRFEDSQTGFDTSNSTPYAAGTWWSNGVGETNGTQQDEWLMTPSLDFTNYVDTLLYFNAIYLTDWNGYVGPNEHNYIKASTDGGSTWDILGDMNHDPEFQPAHSGMPEPLYVWYEMYLWGWSPLPLDLSPYDGEPSVIIAWHVDNSGIGGRALHCVDDVHVDGTYVPPPPPDYNLTLNEGWNLISFPVIQGDESMIQVLSSINGKWDYISVYDPINELWLSNSTYKPDSLNTLNTLNHKLGFWINITESNVTLSLYGQFPSSTIIPLYTGWNLVGYPTTNQRSVADALWGTGADKVEVFDPAEPYRIKEVGPTYLMKPGEGYWVHVPADTTWIVDW